MTRNGSIQAPTASPNAGAHDESWALTGDVARMSLASVLQFLELGRHTGMLVAGTPERVSECVLKEGAILSARHQHLVGREAIVSMLNRPDGRFAFTFDISDVAEGKPMPASPMIMEAVRLEDEFERFSSGFPGDDVALQLRDPNEFPTDPIDCGVDVIMATLAAREGATVRDLIDSVGLAPIKVRLAVAWLGSTGRLEAQSASEHVPASTASPELLWVSRLVSHFCGALRVVVAVGVRNATHDVIRLIKALAKALDSGPAWMSVGPDGSSMARVRPRSSGLLSIASLPITDQHKASFQQLTQTADLVLLDSAAEEPTLQSWQEAAGNVAVFRFASENSESCLLNALKSFASSLEMDDATYEHQRRANGSSCLPKSSKE